MIINKPTIFSIGHSNKPIETFIKKLIENDIDILVDVRTIPMSRFCPHFNKNALYGALLRRNIQYIWKGNNLGGRGINENYEETIEELSLLVNEGKKVCIMCSEADYRKCHRYTKLTPSFEERKIRVFYIEYDI